MILSKWFAIPREEGKFETAYQILKGEYGLVDVSKSINTADYRILVKREESTSFTSLQTFPSQIFRVHCYGNIKWSVLNKDERNEQPKLYDVFYFQYAAKDEGIDEKFFTEDPMKKPLEGTMKLSEKTIDTNFNLVNAGNAEELKDESLISMLH